MRIFHYLRRDLIAPDKFRKYMAYAIGEIILVVIGILIALQVNNWNEDRKLRRIEYRYLTDLIKDLEADSALLEQHVAEAEQISKSKAILVALLNDPAMEVDSVTFHYEQQWLAYRTFRPVTTTLDEMTSSSHLDVIRDKDLKRSIVALYNAYSSLEQDEQLFHDATRVLLSVSRQLLPDMNTPTENDIRTILLVPEVGNLIRKNNANGRRDGISATHETSLALLQRLKAYLAEWN